jgi:hypothetical protein
MLIANQNGYKGQQLYWPVPQDYKRGKNHTCAVPDEDEGGAAGAFAWRQCYAM